MFLARIRVWIPPAERGLGNECGRVFFRISARRATRKRSPKMLKSLYD